MRIVIAIIAAFFAPAALAQEEESAPQTFAFEGATWRVDTAEEAKIERFKGRDALALRRAYVWLDGAEFSDGVIEFDAAFDNVQGFIGPQFRADEKSQRWEEFYFRTHLNQMPDALQYTPVENGTTAWQIFTDGNALAPVSEDYVGWNHVRVVVKGDKADFYFNSDTPVLHVPDLKTDIKAGGVGLRVTGAVTTHVSNIVFRPLRDGEDIVGEAKEAPAMPDGLIEKWTVSSVFPEARVADALTLDQAAVKDLTWTPLDVETNGIANISRLHPRLEDGGSTVFVRQTIRAGKAQMKKLQFGYSDRVRIYLNGKRIYEGVADWRARDYRFLGTVGFFDSVGLDLKKGDNELVVAISETFGGWAWAGAMADRSGIELTD